MKEIYDFQLTDMGSEKIDHCGKVIITRDSGAPSGIYYKIINLPQEISQNLALHYHGTIEILPETFTCDDGRPDPNPNNPAHPYHLRYAIMQDWELK